MVLKKSVPPLPVFLDLLSDLLVGFSLGMSHPARKGHERKEKENRKKLDPNYEFGLGDKILADLGEGKDSTAAASAFVPDPKPVTSDQAKIHIEVGGFTMKGDV